MGVDIFGFQLTIEEFAGLIAFSVVWFVQMIYIILLIVFIFKGKRTEIAAPSISVIVTSRNYKDHLEELLPTLLNQDYEDFEVVVVDDCSTDGTDWLLAEMKFSHGNLKTTKIIQETDFPNALAISIGVRAATKEWLVFVGPLCRIKDKNWLAGYAQSLQPHREVVVGYVNFNSAKGSFKSILKFENFLSYLLSGSARLWGLTMPVFEYNMAYRREKFLDLRGFAAVLDAPFSENELFINKIATKSNSIVQNGNIAPVNFIGEADWIDLSEFKKKQLMLRRKFNFGQQFFRFLYMASRLLLTGSFIVLLIISQFRFWVLGIWSFLVIFEMIWIGVAAKRIGEKNILPMLLVYKTFLPFINLYFVINQLFSGQKRKWK